MDNRIDAVSGSPPVPLGPVEPVNHGRRAAQHDEERATLAAPQPGASFARREDAGAPTYSAPATRQVTPPDAVAPALFEALAPEPWGHPMPERSVWEKAQAARAAVAARTPHAPVTVAAVAATSAPPAEELTPATSVATTAAAPATHAAVLAAGSSAPVSPAWLASLLKSR